MEGVLTRMFTNWGFFLFPPDPPSFHLHDCGENPATEPDGICEVITLPPCDELPYAFELEAGQILNVTVTSESPFELLLCDDSVYEDWMDRGSPTQLPEPIHLYQPRQETHTLKFVPPVRGHYILMLVNPWSEPIDAAFTAKIG